MHDRESLTVQAREERLLAYTEGTIEAGRVIDELPAYSDDVYLQYQYLIGVAQAITRHGRDIAGIGGEHSLDPQKRGRRQ